MVVNGIVYTDDPRVVPAFVRDRRIQAAKSAVQCGKFAFLPTQNSAYYAKKPEGRPLEFRKQGLTLMRNKDANAPSDISNMKIEIQRSVIFTDAMIPTEYLKFASCVNMSFLNSELAVLHDLLTSYNGYIKSPPQGTTRDNEPRKTHDAVRLSVTAYYIQFLTELLELGRIRNIVIGAYAAIDNWLVTNRGFSASEDRFFVETRHALMGIPELIVNLVWQGLYAIGFTNNMPSDSLMEASGISVDSVKAVLEQLNEGAQEHILALADQSALQGFTDESSTATRVDNLLRNLKERFAQA